MQFLHETNPTIGRTPATQSAEDGNMLAPTGALTSLSNGHTHPAGALGFTLIEILVVLAILGLVLSIVATRGPAGHPVLDLRTATASVAEQLRVARARAISTDRPCIFVLDVRSHTFRTGDDPPRPLPPDMAITVLAAAGAVAGAAAEIGFAPDGSSTGGRIEFVAGRQQAIVDVNWLTGRVSIDAR